MLTCAYCELPVPDNVDDVYCNPQCFDAAIDDAIEADKIAAAIAPGSYSATPATSLAELSKYFDTPILLTAVKKKGCKLRSKIVDLRDDAEKRVKNIETFGPDKLLKTKEYFQARADVLNDLLMVMTPSDSSCSCC